MEFKELINKRITNVYVSFEKVDYETILLDQCECFIELNNELYIDIPDWYADKIWIKQLDPKASALLKVNLADKLKHFCGLPSAFDNSVMAIKGQKIVDLLWYPENEDEKHYLMLESGLIITEVTHAPSGTAYAGLHLIESLEKLIEKKGNGLVRFTNSIAH